MSAKPDTANTENGESSLAPTMDENARSFVAINKDDKDEDSPANTTNPEAPVPADTNEQVAEKESPPNKRKRSRDVKASVSAGGAAESVVETPETPIVKRAKGKAGTAEAEKPMKVSASGKPEKKGEQTDAVTSKRKRVRGRQTKVKNETASGEQEEKGGKKVAKSRETDNKDKVLKEEGGESGGEEGQAEGSDVGLNTPPPEDEEKLPGKPSTPSTKSKPWTSEEDQLIIKMAQDKNPWKDIMAALNKLPSCTTQRDHLSAKRRWHMHLKHISLQWEGDEITKLQSIYHEIVKNPFSAIADRMNVAFPSKKFTKGACEKKIKEVCIEVKRE